jgi:hypothetical protein
VCHFCCTLPLSLSAQSKQSSPVVPFVQNGIVVWAQNGIMVWAQIGIMNWAQNGIMVWGFGASFNLEYFSVKQAAAFAVTCDVGLVLCVMVNRQL